MTDIQSLFFYLSVYGISIVEFSMYKQKNRVTAGFGVLISMLILAIVAGIRYNVGTDYGAYYYTFDHLKDYSYRWIITDNRHFNQERGFLLISKFFAGIVGAKGTFGVFALFIVGVFLLTLFKQYKNMELTLIYALFLFEQFTGSFNILRQAVASVIVFWGLKYVFEGKFLKYIVVLIVASSIHMTAFLAVPIYFMWNHKRKDDMRIAWKVGIYSIAILVVISWRTLLQILNESLGGFFINKYSVYLIGNETQNRSFYLKLLLGVLFLCLEKFYRSYDKRYSLFINMYLLGVILEFTGFYSTYIKRIGEYYGGYTGIVLLGSLPLVLTRNMNKTIVRILIYLYEIALFVVVSFIMKQGGYFPYQIR